MSILRAVIGSHPPLTIPTVRREVEQEVQTVVDTHRAATGQAVNWEPEVPIVTSPIKTCTPTTSTFPWGGALPERSNRPAGPAESLV